MERILISASMVPTIGPQGGAGVCVLGGGGGEGGAGNLRRLMEHQAG